MKKVSKYGFTLIELLIAVIIVAVLIAVAVPQYKRAVLKSRYSALLPIARHIKTAQEVYYLGNSYYSDDLRRLDLEATGTITSADTVTYGDNTKVQISTTPGDEEEEDDAYIYVLTSKKGLNNNYIMYQEHSKNYAGNIHCEAKEGDADAQWLCEKGMHGQKLEEGSITPGYTTYILTGNPGDGTFGKDCEGDGTKAVTCPIGCVEVTITGKCNRNIGKWEYEEDFSACPQSTPDTTAACDNGVSGQMTRTLTCKSDKSGWDVSAWDKSACCDPNTKPATQYSCYDNDANTCGTKTRPVTCDANGQWVADDNGWTGTCNAKEPLEAPCADGYLGTRTRTATCGENATNWDYGAWNESTCQKLFSGGCSAAQALGYACELITDDSGKEVQRICATMSGKYICRTRAYEADGSYSSITCAAYETGASGACKTGTTTDAMEVTYDANGNLTFIAACNRVSSDGKSCTSYASNGPRHYTYDSDGNLLSWRRCGNAASDGSCSTYSTGGTSNGYDYTYDSNGNQISMRACSTISSDGTCTAYNQINSYVYTYDSNGNMLSKRRCQTLAADGTCATYASGSDSFSYDYTYDSNGNMINSASCYGVTAEGVCSSYYASLTSAYTYDANGNQTARLGGCNQVASDGTCGSYSYAHVYAYDTSGNQISQRMCKLTNGTCSSYYTYDNYEYTYDANGNKTSERTCSSVAEDGTCSSYSRASVYFYDDKGKQISGTSCSGSNINTDTGDCITYNGLGGVSAEGNPPV